MNAPIRDYWHSVAKGEFQHVPADSDPELIRLKARFAEAPERSSRKARLGELMVARRNELLASDVRARKARARMAARERTDAAAKGLEAVAAAILDVEQIKATQERVHRDCKTLGETMKFDPVAQRLEHPPVERVTGVRLPAGSPSFGDAR